MNEERESFRRVKKGEMMNNKKKSEENIFLNKIDGEIDKLI